MSTEFRAYCYYSAPNPTLITTCYTTYYCHFYHHHFYYYYCYYHYDFYYLYYSYYYYFLGNQHGNKLDCTTLEFVGAAPVALILHTS